MEQEDDWFQEVYLLLLVFFVTLGYAVYLLVTGVLKVLSWPVRVWRKR